ncbi:MAG TPA: hypothetical protein VKM72_16340 [Thermoanaerobaculia bacterium]|nr:hypothetical protein [Thermoanaerobaculia bacterium]
MLKEPFSGLVAIEPEKALDQLDRTTALVRGKAVPARLVDVEGSRPLSGRERAFSPPVLFARFLGVFFNSEGSEKHLPIGILPDLAEALITETWFHEDGEKRLYLTAGRLPRQALLPPPSFPFFSHL